MNTCKFRFSRMFRLVALVLLALLVLSGPASAAGKKDRFFTLTLISPIGNAPREKAAQIIARDLEKIGIGVNLRYMEFASISPRWKTTAQKGVTFENGGYDMYLTRTDFSTFPDPTGIYRRYGCDQDYPNGNNRVRYCNPEFDKLIYKALGTVNDQARWDIASQAIKVVRDDLATIPLFRPKLFFVVRSDIKYPEYRSTVGYNTYAFRWAKREIPGKTKEQMSLRERTLIFVQPSDTEGFLEGYTKTDYSEWTVKMMCFDSLIQPVFATYAVGPVKDRGPKPALAESWSVSEDGKVWTVKLKKGVTWHDGAPFGADDVIFTYDLLNNKKAAYGSNKFIKENGITWKKIDDYTVEFTCEKFNPLFTGEMFWISMLPKHLLSKIPPEDLLKSKYHTSTMVGTGPFVLDEYKPGEYLKYKANENYYGGRPWFDNVVIRIVPKGATAWFGLQTGEIDQSSYIYGFTHELKEVEKNPDLYALWQLAWSAQAIRVNHEHPQLKKREVRWAISLACNRRVMVDVISAGLGTVADQHVPKESPAYVADLPPLEYDLDEAKRMLIKAGFNYDDITVKGPK